jgi:hypothetical protein
MRSTACCIPTTLTDRVVNVKRAAEAGARVPLPPHVAAYGSLPSHI